MRVPLGDQCPGPDIPLGNLGELSQSTPIWINSPHVIDTAAIRNERLPSCRQETIRAAVLVNIIRKLAAAGTIRAHNVDVFLLIDIGVESQPMTVG